MAHAGQQVSPPRGGVAPPKLNPEACLFSSSAPAKCEFPNCNLSFPHFLGKCPVFKSKSAFDRQKWVTSKNLCVICFKKVHTHMSQCRLLDTMKKMERKICQVNNCNGQHNYLLHMEHGKATVNMFMVLDEEDEEAEEEKPASKDEEEDGSPGARLMRGILEVRGSRKGAQETSENSSEEQEEVKQGS